MSERLSFLSAVTIAAACVAGCEQSQTVNQCAPTENDVVSSPLQQPDAGQGGEGGDAGGSVGSGGHGGASPLLADGAPCSANDECENAACIPAFNSFGSGYCWGPMMDGCIVVGDGSPFHAQCDGALQRLYTCGDYDVSLLGMCTELGTGEFGETYHCCSTL